MLDPDAARAWSRAVEGRDALIAVMNEIADATLEVVREELSEHRGESVGAAVDLHRHKDRIVWPWKDRINIQLTIPPAVSERLRIQFLGGSEEGPHFTVEARFPDARPLLADATHPLCVVTSHLREHDFQVGRDWENYWSRVHKPEDWLSTGSGLHERLLEIVRLDVRALVQSGIFDALPGQDSRSLSPPESVAEDLGIDGREGQEGT
jgi:hypothetical protein